MRCQEQDGDPTASFCSSMLLRRHDVHSDVVAGRKEWHLLAVVGRGRRVNINLHCPLYLVPECSPNILSLYNRRQDKLTVPLELNLEVFRMKTLSILVTCLFGMASAQVNRTLTNGWGSTPSQRHYINQTQALAVINAGVANSQ